MYMTQTRSSSAMNITREDIEQLVREPSPAMRQCVCKKIAAGYNAGLYSDSETRLANEIFDCS